MKPDSLVARVLKSKYWKNVNFLDCGAGTRPSYAWRSILYGRELLQKGLINRIGNGDDTKVWLDNWIQDPSPRPLMYRPDSTVDLTLSVADLIIPISNIWDIRRIRSLFVDEDVPWILSIKPSFTRNDRLCWAFTKDGSYSSQSGYKLIESMRQSTSALPPVEKRLWSNI